MTCGCTFLFILKKKRRGFGHDRGIFVEKVGDVERGAPDGAAVQAARVGHCRVERGLRGNPVVIDVTSFHPGDVVHHAVVVRRLQHEAPRTEVVVKARKVAVPFIFRTGLRST